MTEIKVTRKHGLTVAQAKRIAQKAAEDLASEYELTSAWDGDTLRFTRSGVEGSMAVTPNEIRLGVKLGLMLKAFKGRIQKHIEHRLDELLLAAEAVAEGSGSGRSRGSAAKKQNGRSRAGR